VLKYDTQLDPGDESTSHAQMLNMVGHNKAVLDVGCATGYLAKALREQGCTVSGVEYDQAAAEVAAQYLEQLVVGDLETLDLVQELGATRFDVVVFGDVLEHLRDPLVPLRQAVGLLRPGGSVVISVPNVAHAAVRLSLLAGRWDYRTLGLLDYTHIRFFTRENLIELLRQAGLVAVDFRRTTAGVFETELGVRADDVDPALVETLLEDPDATTYQFVVRAIRDDGDAGVRRLAETVEMQRRRVHDLERELARVAADRDRVASLVQDAQERAARAEQEAAAAQSAQAVLEADARLAAQAAAEAARAADHRHARALATRPESLSVKVARKVLRRPRG
jgi:2-polyprenyl-3-methyl-5-hydroxy-6-metoxy-1,4-benzoquinol methylase